MATMNKPSSGDTNWYQSVTDNWTSIENNLIDKSILTAKGDLIVASGSSTPARLAVGSDGQILVADSTQSSGVKWALSSGIMTDALLLKPFFSGLGFLPATTFKEELSTFPTPDFQNLNSGTLALSMSRARFASSGEPANFGWDTGAARTKLLAIVGGLRLRQYSNGIFFASSNPGASEIPDGSYLANLEIANSRVALFKKTAGPTWTLLGSAETGIDFADSYEGPTWSLAFYYDDSTGRLIIFLRAGAEQWFPVVDTTDSSFTTMRYVGFRPSRGTSGYVYWHVCPLAIYYE